MWLYSCHHYPNANISAVSLDITYLLNSRFLLPFVTSADCTGLGVCLSFLLRAIFSWCNWIPALRLPRPCLAFPWGPGLFPCLTLGNRLINWNLIPAPVWHWALFSPCISSSVRLTNHTGSPWILKPAEIKPEVLLPFEYCALGVVCPWVVYLVSRLLLKLQVPVHA